MSSTQGIIGFRGLNLWKIPALSDADYSKVAERSRFVQPAIAPEYSLNFPKWDNSVPGGESPLGAKLPKLCA